MRLPVLSAAAIRAAEQTHPAELADGTLMSRAATAVATECLALLRDSGGIVGRHVLLLVGAGDNGGDALFAGAVLAKRGVAVFALPLSRHMHDSGATALRMAHGRFIDVPTAFSLFDRLDLVIDGIVGLGSSRGLDGDAALLARAIDDAQLFTVAIDIPSGVVADTGAVPGIAIDADVTITFGALRRAHVLTPAALKCGDVLVADIGVPMDGPDAALTDEGDWFSPPAANVDKYARGVVGVVTGSAAYSGAAVLSVGAAARSGAGLVHYFGDAAAAVISAEPEAVCHDLSALDDHSRCHAWLVGCGLGTDDRAARALRALLEQPTPLIIDADAITLLAEHDDLRDALHARGVAGALALLTPHAAEAARLARSLNINPDVDRLELAKAMASSLLCVVLLKGPTTIVTDGERFLATPPLGARLATAGSGDVLAGLIAGATARWSAQGPFRRDHLMELATASALRHAAAADADDVTASDLIIGLSDAPSATMTS